MGSRYRNPHCSVDNIIDWQGKLSIENSELLWILNLSELKIYSTIGGLMERSFVKENARERERLISLVESLKDEELSLPLGDDWTIAIALAHLAFWDQRSLFLVRKWKKSGEVEFSPIDMDVTNDSLLGLWRALPPRIAASLAVSSAEEVDRELEETPSDLITKIESIGEKNRVYRSVHRKMHIDQIEDLLKKRNTT